MKEILSRCRTEAEDPDSAMAIRAALLTGPVDTQPRVEITQVNRPVHLSQRVWPSGRE
jgi:hypothetical protein